MTTRMIPSTLARPSISPANVSGELWDAFLPLARERLAVFASARPGKAFCPYARRNESKPLGIFRVTDLKKLQASG